jgi:hypothetical protein
MATNRLSMVRQYIVETTCATPQVQISQVDHMATVRHDHLGADV